MVRSGAAQLAITGGSEAVFSLGFLKAWEAMRVVSPDTCRPFSKDRRGLILGEGGAMLVLEPLESAQARGARIYAEMVGFGMSSDAFHITQPSPEGAARADASGAIGCRAQAGRRSATSTRTEPRRQANDATETAAIRKVFGAHADRLAISSTKSMHGHALGAAGAMEGVATVLALQHCILPPTANYNEPDPACDLGRDPEQRAQDRGGVRALELIRIRRLERGARVQARLVIRLFGIRFFGSLAGQSRLLGEPTNSGTEQPNTEQPNNPIIRRSRMMVLHGSSPLG